jgi:hypothetical protein
MRQNRRARFRFGMSTDVRNLAVQAFLAMHVAAAVNWSAMSVREYAAALRLSPTSLRKWRDRLDDGEAEIDWRAQLHRQLPVAGTSDKRTPPETGLTAPPSDDPAPPRQPLSAGPNGQIARYLNRIYPVLAKMAKNPLDEIDTL